MITLKINVYVPTCIRWKKKPWSSDACKSSPLSIMLQTLHTLLITEQRCFIWGTTGSTIHKIVNRLAFWHWGENRTRMEGRWFSLRAKAWTISTQTRQKTEHRGNKEGREVLWIWAVLISGEWILCVRVYCMCVGESKTDWRRSSAQLV